VCFGNLHGISPPHGSSAHGLERVYSAKSREPRWAEGKEYRVGIAEWHTARDTQGGTTGANGDSGHVPEQELELTPTGPDNFEAGRQRHGAGLFEDVHDT